MSRLFVLLVAWAASSPWRPPEGGRIVVGVQSDPMGSFIMAESGSCDIHGLLEVAPTLAVAR